LRWIRLNLDSDRRHEQVRGPDDPNGSGRPEDSNGPNRPKEPNWLSGHE